MISSAVPEKQNPLYFFRAQFPLNFEETVNEKWFLLLAEAEAEDRKVIYIQNMKLKTIIESLEAVESEGPAQEKMKP